MSKSTQPIPPGQENLIPHLVSIVPGPEQEEAPRAQEKQGDGRDDDANGTLL